MKKLLLLISLTLSLAAQAAGKYDNPDTIVVARDGTGEFRTIDEAIEVCRAFMDYHKVIYVKNGIYKEKLIIPQWLQNIEICGESAEKTIITYDDHANVRVTLGTAEARTQPMGTFRTYTLKIEANAITLKNLTIENNSARLGQAVALHTEGDSSSKTATSAVPPTLSSAPPRHGLRTAPSRASSTATSQPPPPHRSRLTAMSSTIVA